MRLKVKIVNADDEYDESFEPNLRESMSVITGSAVGHIAAQIAYELRFSTLGGPQIIELYLKGYTSWFEAQLLQALESAGAAGVAELKQNRKPSVEITELVRADGTVTSAVKRRIPDPEA